MTQPFPNPISLSIIICTHNPRPEFLNETLTALRQQTLPPQNWELLLIDNASDSPIQPCFLLDWHPHGRHIREDRLGLTFARFRGIQEATSDLLVFVDDDNILDPNYLSEALRIAGQWPMLGVWGGAVLPRFEKEPPQWTRQLWYLLAIREVPQDRWGNDPASNSYLPCGAGMCLRRVVTTKYLEEAHHDPLRQALDRKGNALTSCGDTDMALTATDIGLGMGLFKSLCLTHLMPASRLEESYLLRLVEGSYYSGVWLGYLRNKSSGVPRRTPRRMIANLLEFIISSSRDRRFIFAIAKGKARASREIKALNAQQTSGTQDGNKK